MDGISTSSTVSARSKATVEPRLLPQLSLWLSVWLLLVLPSLLTRSLLPVDETRYAGVAWEMWSRGEFLVPLLNGEPYSHKPPLLFWLIQLGWTAFGVNDIWPRLVPALFSLATVLLTWRIGRRLWPDRPELGVLAGSVLLGSALWGLYTPALMFDLLMSFWVLLAVLGMLWAAGGRPVTGWMLVAVAIGLGVLTKGPVTLLYTLPPALLAPIWHRSVTWRWYAGLAAAVAVAAALALAWAIPAASHGGPAYARAIFWGQSAGRVVDSFAHDQPVWWYLPLLPLLLFPWLLWPTAWRGLARACRRPQPPVRFLLCWLVPVFAALCLISGKQVHYLLPLFPAAALLLGAGLGTVGAARGGRQWPVASLAVVLGISLLVLREAPLAAHWRSLQQDIGILPGLLLILLGAATLLPRGAVGVHQRTLFLMLTTASMLAVLSAGVAAPAMRYYDLNPAANRIAALQQRGIPVAHLGRHHGRFHFTGRLHAPIVEIDDGEAVAWARNHPDARIVAYYRGRIPQVQPGPEFSQPFRSRTLVIWPAAAWRDGDPAGIAGSD